MIIQNEKNEIYVCGDNWGGQLGLGDYKNRNKFEKAEYDFGKIKNIACGYHTIIQNEKNEVYVCGWNGSGQLGLGDYDNRNKFEKVEKNFGEIKNIACGESYTAILNEKNEIYVSGENHYGQFGFGDNKYRNEFEKIECDFGKVKNIICGENHIVILNEKNEIYMCGRNWEGQLGLSNKKNINQFEKIEHNFGGIKKITCGGHHTIIQNEKNEIYVCGYNNYSQLGLGDKNIRSKFEKVRYKFGEIKKIALSGHHTIIQNEKNEVYVCGDNRYGQLGMGDNKNRNEFEKLDFPFGKIKNIICGHFYTVIQNEKNEIYVCGYNEFGQLSLGDNKDRNEFEKVDTEDIIQKIYNFKLNLDLNTEEIVL